MALPEQDENWCFRAETTKLLGLSVAQIHTTLTDGDNSVATLTESFKQLAEFSDAVARLCHARESAEQSEQIQHLAINMSEQITNAIVAFQFYDRLCQRLQHVAKGLEQLSELVGDDALLNAPTGWRELREHIRSSYSLEAEHVMYHAIMSGASVGDALAIYKDKLNESAASDDIELF